MPNTAVRAAAEGMPSITRRTVLIGAAAFATAGTVTASAAPAADEWAFEIGQCVTHVDQDMPSLIMARQRTSKGTEIYGVRSFARDDENRDRMMLGEVLVATEAGGLACGGCLLRNTSLCPLARV